MKNTLSVLLALFLVACTQATQEKPLLQDQFSQILDITYSPDTLTGGRGWFTDQGSWMGFTLPEKGSKTIGFSGPYDLESRRWISQSLLQASFILPEQKSVDLAIDSTNYIPGAIRLTAGNGSDLRMNQEMMFIDKNHAIVSFSTNKDQTWVLHGKLLSELQTLHKEKENLLISLSNGEILALSFEGDVKIETNGKEYTATSDKKKQTYAVISYFNHKKELVAGLQKAAQIIASPESYIKDQRKKWNDYLEAVIRPELPEQYNRIAAKSVVTLMSNWRSAKGGLLHDGVVPSHAVGYFVGFWAWDSWKHAYALAKIAPSLAKDQIRTMFDYQTPDGMVIDCIYTNSEENNPRDSKPPLAAWAVNRIYDETK
ncbi:MAG: MGH1-like glycoside hydrolase domain-containing protein, partial [Bacteroidales bacterium]